MNSSPPFLPGSQAVSVAGPCAVGDRPSRRSLILEVRELYRQGDPRPVETVLSRHPEAGQLESLVFDLIHEEYHQRCRDGQRSDAAEFNQRFSAWGIDFEDFLAAKDLLENHRDRLTECEDLPALECLRNFQVLGEVGSTQFVKELVLAIQKIPWGKLKKWFEPRSQTDRLRSAPSDNASWYHGLMLDKSEVRDIDRRLWRVFNEIKRRESKGMTSTGRSQNV